MKKVLKKLGFEDYEVSTYRFLVKNGECKPSYISQILDIKRPTVYKALNNLESNNLVERDMNKDGDSTFRAKHPRFIQYLVQKKQKESDRIMEKFLFEYSSFTELFSHNNIAPVIDVLHGIDGLKKLHLEVENSADEMLLFRSFIDRDFKELYEEIDRHVTSRTKKGILTKVITPFVKTSIDTIKNYGEFENNGLNQIKFILDKSFNLETQIMVFNDKVAITNYRNEIITLLIHQKNIANSFKTLFHTLWDSGDLIDIREFVADNSKIPRECSDPDM